MDHPHSISSFKSRNHNHMMLKRGKRAPYEVHKMNKFISIRSPKPRLNVLTEDQSLAISLKIEEYQKMEYRALFKRFVFTLVISAGLFMLFGELWRWIN